MPFRSPAQQDPLEEGMATHSSLLARRIPWTEEPGGWESLGSQRVGHDWSNWACMPWIPWLWACSGFGPPHQSSVRTDDSFQRLLVAFSWKPRSLGTLLRPLPMSLCHSPTTPLYNPTFSTLIMWKSWQVANPCPLGLWAFSHAVPLPEVPFPPSFPRPDPSSSSREPPCPRGLGEEPRPQGHSPQLTGSLVLPSGR